MLNTGIVGKFREEPHSRATYDCALRHCLCKLCNTVIHLLLYSLSGRWQAPAAVLPPEGWQRGRGPEGPEDKGHGHSRAREWPKHASPRARRARGRAKLSARLGACQCYYMFFTTQLKIAKFKGRSQDVNVG